MRLVEHSAFDDAIRAAASHYGLLTEWIRKDYWVTRALEAIAQEANLKNRVVFKGGTSLSKGWSLIDRFSEDIDLLVTGPDHGEVPESKKERERTLKRIKECIEKETPLRIPNTADTFWYTRSAYHIKLNYPLPEHAASPSSDSKHRVLVEGGYRGGPNPIQLRPISSMVADFLNQDPTRLAAVAGCDEDLTPFEMNLLRPDRTFVEKILYLHQKLDIEPDGVRETQTRHCYDIVQLYRRSADVKSMMNNGTIVQLVEEAIQISNRYYGTGMNATVDFSTTNALNPTAEQTRILRDRFAAEESMYVRDPLAFSDIIAAMKEIRGALPGQRK
jgi:hypothetical protein